MRWVVGVLVFAGYLFVATPAVYAEPALGLQPLQYVETLKKGERKQAYVDVANPSAQPVTVQFSVQGFRQVDDKGTLSFYDDDKITNGILLDYQEKGIPAKKTLRLFFVVDGTKLPTGDVFAAIFAQTKPVETARVPSIRVGTLLILTNGSPGARKVSVEEFKIPLLHTGDLISGQIKIKNTAPVSSASGFFPEITIRTWPFGPNATITGPLVYAGNTRTLSLNQPSNQLGIYKITASYDESSKERWVILITGVWRWVVLIGFTVILIAILTYKLLGKRRRKKL